jgi:hypothetical protein
MTLVLAVMIVVSTALFQLLWNTTMPDVFGLTEVSFWQSFRLLLLAALVFGSGSFVQLGQ